LSRRGQLGQIYEVLGIDQELDHQTVEHRDDHCGDRSEVHLTIPGALAEGFCGCGRDRYAEGGVE
jgi:hypothetical protein